MNLTRHEIINFREKLHWHVVFQIFNKPSGKATKRVPTGFPFKTIKSIHCFHLFSSFICFLLAVVAVLISGGKMSTKNLLLSSQCELEWLEEIHNFMSQTNAIVSLYEIQNAFPNKQIEREVMNNLLSEDERFVTVRYNAFVVLHLL